MPPPRLLSVSAGAPPGGGPPPATPPGGRTPTEQVLGVGGRVFVARREPPAVLSLAASTPGGDVPVVAQWPVDPRSGTAVDGRLAVCFAVTLLAPVPAAGAYALTLSVNGEPARRLPFAVVDTSAL